MLFSPLASVCPDPVTCAQSCVIEGVNYEQTYGITTNGNSLRMNFVTVGKDRMRCEGEVLRCSQLGPYDTNVGGRVYLMSDNTHYQMFNLMSMLTELDWRVVGNLWF